jgi:hypothetical protein
MIFREEKAGFCLAHDQHISGVNVTPRRAKHREMLLVSAPPPIDPYK